MNLYKSLIWCSLLLIIVEGWVLTGYKLDPLPVKKEGMVLGETTASILNEVALKTYPASYYSEPVIDEVIIEEQATNLIIETKDNDKTAIEQAKATLIKKETVISTPEYKGNSLNEAPAAHELSPDRKVKYSSSSETKTAVQETELEQVVNLLNSGSGAQEVNTKTEATSDSKDSVINELIRKNRRLYHKNLKSLLKQIDESLDEEQTLD